MLKNELAGYITKFIKNELRNEEAKTKDVKSEEEIPEEIAPTQVEPKDVESEEEIPEEIAPTQVEPKNESVVKEALAEEVQD
jgi:small subunit ribosomal protein S17e